MYRVAASIAANSPVYRVIWEKVEIILTMGLYDLARPNECTPIPTNLFLIELLVNATN